MTITNFSAAITDLTEAMNEWTIAIARMSQSTHNTIGHIRTTSSPTYSPNRIVFDLYASGLVFVSQKNVMAYDQLGASIASAWYRAYDH